MNTKRSLVLALAGASSAVAWGQIPAGIVARVGDPLDGSTISTLNAPFTNGFGQVGFVAALADASRSIWIGSGSVFNSNDAIPDLLTGGESTMGISDEGGFIYSPSFNGNDAVYTHLGLLLAEGSTAPGLPGMFSSFNSRPTMTANGAANWIAGFTATPGGASAGRVFYTAPGAHPSNTTAVLKSGDIVAGFPIGTSGIGFAYDVSPNNQHRIVHLTLNTGSTTNDTCIWVNGNVIARESLPNGQGDNWQNFSAMGINNFGQFVFTGDTDGTTASDAFIAVNGQIVLREGNLVGGVTLTGSSRWISIDNFGHVAFIHDTSAGESLFYGDAANLTSAVVVATVGANLDTNGDGTGDHTLADFKASATIGPGLDIAEDAQVFVEVDLNNGTSTFEAIIQFNLGQDECGCTGDMNGDGIVDLTDLTLFLSSFGTIAPGIPIPCADIDGDGDVDIVDLALFLAAFGQACQQAMNCSSVDWVGGCPPNGYEDPANPDGDDEPALDQDADGDGTDDSWSTPVTVENGGDTDAGGNKISLPREADTEGGANPDGDGPNAHYSPRFKRPGDAGKGTEIGACVYPCGRNSWTVYFLDFNNDGTPDQFLKSEWISRDYIDSDGDGAWDTDSGRSTTFTTDLTARKIVPVKTVRTRGATFIIQDAVIADLDVSIHDIILDGAPIGFPNGVGPMQNEPSPHSSCMADISPVLPLPPPGGTAIAQGEISNSSMTSKTYYFATGGVNAGGVTVTPSIVTLLPGATAQIQVSGTVLAPGSVALVAYAYTNSGDQLENDMAVAIFP